MLGREGSEGRGETGIPVREPFTLRVADHSGGNPPHTLSSRSQQAFFNSTLMAFRGLLLSKFCI